ncbi:MAG: hypothetical protein AAGH15_06575 [Myxococcota bacterium]
MRETRTLGSAEATTAAWMRAGHGLAGALLVLLAGCGDDVPAGALDAGPPGCVPEEAAWTGEVQALVAERCGTCHGEAPNFGAPFPIVDYAPLIEGPEGARIVDRMAVRVGEGSMPPVGIEQPSFSQRDAIVRWASCGEQTADPIGGTGASRPPFGSPAESPTGLETIDLLAEEFEVRVTDTDRYVDFDFANLTDEDVFIRRFEPVIDESRVLHHLTLRRGDPMMGDAGMEYVYAWAPGTGPFEFPEGGIRLTGDDVLRLQIHYNNGARLEDVRDSSGIRLYVGPVAGTEFVMSDPGPGAFGFSVPARSTETVERTCRVNSPVSVLTSMPHMHEIGQSFELLVDGEVQLSLEGWSFENQLFYELPLELDVGQELTVRCTFQNAGSDDVFAGPRTEDEMCYAFTYVSPATEGFCGPAGVSELEYEPGLCISDPTAVTTVVPTATEDSPVFDEVTELADALRPATRALLVTDFPALTTVADITFAGQLRHEAGRVEVDGAIHIVAPFEGAEEGLQVPLSAAGRLQTPGAPSLFDTDCPGPGVAPFTVGTVDGVPAMRFDLGEDLDMSIVVWVFFD